MGSREGAACTHSAHFPKLGEGRRKSRGCFPMLDRGPRVMLAPACRPVWHTREPSQFRSIWMTFSFDDMTKAIEDYPTTYVDVDILDVTVPDNALNVDEYGNFKVKVTNR